MPRAVTQKLQITMEEKTELNITNQAKIEHHVAGNWQGDKPSAFLICHGMPCLQLKIIKSDKSVFIYIIFLRH